MTLPIAQPVAPAVKFEDVVKLAESVAKVAAIADKHLGTAGKLLGGLARAFRPAPAVPLLDAAPPDPFAGTDFGFDPFALGWPTE